MTAAPTHLHLRPVEAFEITDESGKVIITRATVIDRWQGMARLQTPDGLTAIVDAPGPFGVALSDAFKRVFSPDSTSTLTCALVKASPALIEKLAIRSAGVEAAAQPPGK